MTTANMKAGTLVILLLATVFASGCHDRRHEMITRFENQIKAHAFPDEGAYFTGANATINARMAHYKTPGLSVAIINDYQLDWERGYGFLESGKPGMVNPDSIFQAGSVSKFVTALIVMHYVQAGVFDLDADVDTYLKSWKMPRNAFNKDNAITLRHLLSHQSGLPSSNMERDANEPMPGLVQILNAEKPAINKPAAPNFVPGQKWSYSNIGYVVIQLVLEDTFGKSLDGLAQQVIFEPLGMNSSTFDYPLKAGLQMREAMPHSSAGEARKPSMDSLARAQGGLMTTTRDMSKLLIELMNTYRGEPGKIISRTTLESMLEKQVSVPAGVFGFPIDMGLGVFVDGEGDSACFMHPGHNYPGTVFLVFACPGLGDGVSLGINGNIGDRLEIEVVSTLAEIYGWPGGRYFEQGK